MMAASYIFIFILGLVFGSFFNVCAIRIPKGEDIFISRSMCLSCKTTLTALDLIPIFSYMLSKGKCRHCGKAYSIRYLLIELITGFLFVFTYFKTGFNIILIKNLTIVSLLLVITLIDYKHFIIPHSITITGMLFALLWYFFNKDMILSDMFLGLIVGFTLLFIFVLFNAMGGGDAMMAGMMGLFLGLKYNIMMILISFILGGIFSFYMIFTKQKKRKDMLPFGPFLAISSFIVLFYGEQILKWYIY